MSKENEQMKAAFKSVAETVGPVVIIPAVVTTVNDVDNTIAVEFSEGGTIEDVRLKAVVKDGNQFILIPKVGSNVLVGKIENSDEYIIISVDEITEVNLIIGTVKYKVDETGFLFQKDTDTLKDALTLIVDAVKQIFVVEGNNVDYPKLAQAQVKINNILK
jgi:hypothetical protein